MSSDSIQQRVPYAVSPPRYSVAHQMVTTAFELPNYRVVQNLGVVRGIVVRSRNVFATIGASLQTIVGGNITVNMKPCTLSTVLNVDPTKMPIQIIANPMSRMKIVPSTIIQSDPRIPFRRRLLSS